MSDHKYLKLLGDKYPTTQCVSSEIIQLESILELPKGTEHFMSDLHGEDEAFTHIVNNAVGVIRNKINIIFGDKLTTAEKNQLATIIYYPKEKIKQCLCSLDEKEKIQWYKETLLNLVEVCKFVSTKYSRKQVGKSIPKDFEYIIEVLLNESSHVSNKVDYYEKILDTIIEINRQDAFIDAITTLIKRLAVDCMHIVGDIFERGTGPHIIINKLMEHHNTDIQWGNHDILWMGAASGCECSIATAIYLTARYNNLEILEDGYGINLRPLSDFAESICKPSKAFYPKPPGEGDKIYTEKQLELISKMSKCAAVLMFKLEGLLIDRNPIYNMDDRKLLHTINYENQTITLGGVVYDLKDTDFPTVDKNDPYKLTKEEEEVVEHLVKSFRNSDLLQTHTKFLFSHGSLYKVVNNNLLYHACLPMNEEGGFDSVTLFGKQYKGKNYFDEVDKVIRKGYFLPVNHKEKEKYTDYFWYWWCGEKSPLYGKDKMTTFEQALIADKKSYKEILDFYYHFITDEETCDAILEEFKIDKDKGHIINGHVPVRLLKGETPVKGNGKLIVIDGGFSKAYQPQTGIAGYTLIYNSYEMRLSAHEPLGDLKSVIANDGDLYSKTEIVTTMAKRMRVKDTDKGKEIISQIGELKKLLFAYENGIIKQKSKK